MMHEWLLQWSSYAYITKHVQVQDCSFYIGVYLDLVIYIAPTETVDWLYWKLVFLTRMR